MTFNQNKSYSLFTLSP